MTTTSTPLVTNPDPAAHAATGAPAPKGDVRRPAPDIVDVWGLASFPASDPPANW